MHRSGKLPFRECPNDVRAAAVGDCPAPALIDRGHDFVHDGQVCPFESVCRRNSGAARGFAANCDLLKITGKLGHRVMRLMIFYRSLRLPRPSERQCKSAHRFRLGNKNCRAVPYFPAVCSSSCFVYSVAYIEIIARLTPWLRFSCIARKLCRV